MTNSTAIDATKNGMADKAIFSNGTSAMGEATNRQTPNGGVARPILRLTVMMIPKWIGSIPILCAKGNKIGVKSIIAANVSIMVPMNRRRRFISNRIKTLFFVREVMALATISGTVSAASIHPNR